jgi:hypothetical protein
MCIRVDVSHMRACGGTVSTTFCFLKLVSTSTLRRCLLLVRALFVQCSPANWKDLSARLLRIQYPVEWTKVPRRLTLFMTYVRPTFVQFIGLCSGASCVFFISEIKRKPYLFFFLYYTPVTWRAFVCVFFCLYYEYICIICAVATALSRNKSHIILIGFYCYFYTLKR